MILLNHIAVILRSHLTETPLLSAAPIIIHDQAVQLIFVHNDELHPI